MILPVGFLLDHTESGRGNLFGGAVEREGNRPRPDPADVEGDEARRRAAFFETVTLASQRINLFLALPMEKLEKLALQARVKAIGHVGQVASPGIG